MNRRKKLLNNEQGQSVMEYIILTSLIGIFCLAAVGKVGKKLNKRLDQIHTKIEKETQIKV